MQHNNPPSPFHLLEHSNNTILIAPDAPSLSPASAGEECDLMPLQACERTCPLPRVCLFSHGLALPEVHTPMRKKLLPVAHYLEQGLDLHQIILSF